MKYEVAPKDFDIVGLALWILNEFTPLWLVMLISIMIGGFFFGMIVSKEFREVVWWWVKVVTLIGIGSIVLMIGTLLLHR